MAILNSKPNIFWRFTAYILFLSMLGYFLQIRNLSIPNVVQISE